MYDPYTGRWLQELPRELARPNMQPRYEIVEVNGRKGAEALPMGPNSQALVMDQQEPVVYIIQTDGAGLKTVGEYDLTPHVDKQQKAQEDLLQLIRQLNDKVTELEGRINESTTWQRQQRREPAIDGPDGHIEADVKGAEPPDGAPVYSPAAGL